MSILLTSDNGWIISHGKFFEKMKIFSPIREQFMGSSKNDNDTKLGDGTAPVYLSLNPKLFEITEPFKDKIKGKPVQTLTNIPLCDTSKIVKTLSDSILCDPRVKNVLEMEGDSEKSKELLGLEYHERENSSITGSERSGSSCESSKRSWPKNNFMAVETCQQFFEKVKHVEFPPFHGENPIRESAVLSCVPESSGIQNGSIGHRYIFPEDTKFYCNDISKMEEVFQENGELGFDLIVMDPPWWNKFIRRRKRKQHEAGYEMIDDDSLAQLPIHKILNEDGIICVWCTNAKSHQDKLINELFLRWGVRHERTLYWLKVTKSGIPVCPFNAENKKQPYETIIVGRKESQCSEWLLRKTSNPSKVVISVPSSINSHKPPIINVVKQMYPDRVFHRKLEIFARYLTPGFISYGNEVVKLQHESLYTGFTKIGDIIYDDGSAKAK